METSDDIDRKIKATRRRRLIEFINSKESQVEASAILGYDPGYISQLKMKNHRGIGEGVARFMERHAGLPEFWFDDIVVDVVLTPRERQLIENFRAASEKRKDIAETILERPPADEAGLDTTIILPEEKAS